MISLDIVINGGGLVGLSLALALKGSQFKIGLIEKKTTKEKGNKAIALSFPSVTCLSTLGLRKFFEDEASPISEIHISEQGRFGVARLLAKDHRLPALGYVVDGDALEQTLWDRVKNLKNVALFCPDEILHCEKQTKICQLELSSKKKIQSSLVVSAEGAYSVLRKLEGLHATSIDYQETAILSHLDLEQSHLGRAYERFTKEGSIAFLPFGENRVKSVLVVPNSISESLLKKTEKEYREYLQILFGFELGPFIGMSSPLAFPLQSLSQETLYTDRMVWLGNAANTLHPIAAQGFNLGLRDVATLAEVLSIAEKEHQDLGSPQILKNYSQRRTQDHQMTQTFTQNLRQPNIFRSLGLLSCEFLNPLKQKLVALGMGQIAPLPKLCRGLALYEI